MATTSVWAVNDNLKRVLDYAANKEKTESKINISEEQNADCIHIGIR